MMRLPPGGGLCHGKVSAAPWAGAMNWVPGGTSGTAADLCGNSPACAVKTAAVVVAVVTIQVRRAWADEIPFPPLPPLHFQWSV